MLERTKQWLMTCAADGKVPVMTPVEMAFYDAYRKEMTENPDMERHVPTNLPVAGIKMRYRSTDAAGLTADEVASISEKAKAMIALLEKQGVSCENGSLTVVFKDMKYHEMTMKIIRNRYQLILPRRSCVSVGQPEEQLSYGICAYTMRNLNPEEKYVMPALEDLVCRVLSVFLLRQTGFADKADEVLQSGGTRFKSEVADNPWERGHDTANDVRRLAALFTWDDLVPFIQLRDYVHPGEICLRSLNVQALKKNYPDSAAIKALCDIAGRIEDATTDFVDYMMSDP